MGELGRTLDTEGFRNFQALQNAAVDAVTNRFYSEFGSVYERFGDRGREATREDLAFHLEFLRPVLEFGMLEPMVDYLRWLENVLGSRGVPVEHLALSLEWLAEFFLEAMNPAEGATVAAALRSARERYLAASAEPLTLATSPEPWPEAVEFEAALLAGDHTAALALVRRCMAAGHDLVEVELHVIRSALYQIGSRWQNNQISVAREHLATAIALSVMTVGLLQSAPAASIGKRVLLACVQGNQHAVGLRMVADALVLAGWEVQYLGPDVPIRSLIQQIEEWKPDLLGLSASFPQQIRAAKSTIQQLRERLGDARPAVIIGGLAINRFSHLADFAGADAWCLDAREAVVRASQIVGFRGPDDALRA